MHSQPLTDTEFDRLGELLSRFGGVRSMNLEKLDGLFAALICGPDFVTPSEYLPEIWGKDPAIEDAPVLEEFISLITRYWNAICDTLLSGDVFTPLLLEDEQGIAHANDWANGFVRGMQLRREGWASLLEDDDHAGSLVPIFALAHEHDPDPEVRPYDKPISVELREKLIVSAAAG